mmetsp:Transcript_30791/g.83393  ORF Transcript_30791/g.83393 Transcript_30791/m.83393 type:complete len:197 (-) Transcript_30791:92-682(-)
MADFVTILTVILGTPLGLIMLLMAGAGKLFPFHPMNKALAFGFANVYGPFLGCPGMPLRIVIGLGEFLGGLGLLVGLLGDCFGLYSKDLSDTCKALIIVAGIALFIVTSVAAMVHKYVDGSPKAPAGFSVLALVFTLLRVFFVGPDHSANQITATVGSVLVMLGVVVTIFINRAQGTNEKNVEEENNQLQEMMGGK